MRILIAENDAVIADALVRALRHSGHAVDHVPSGTEADGALAAETFDMLILDLGLAGMSGYQVLSKLRGNNSHVPVLILSAEESLEARVRGLDLGADDYLAKPFALEELEARVRALARRSAGGSTGVIRIGDLSFDQVGRVARHNGVRLDLSSREFALLEILVQRSGRLISKEQLAESLCKWGEGVSLNAIEVYMHRLRKKIEPSGVRIVTLRGLGYCLERVQESKQSARNDADSAIRLLQTLHVQKEAADS